MRMIITRPIQVRPLEDRTFVLGEPLTSERWNSISRKFIPNRNVSDVSYLLHHLLNWGQHSQFPQSAVALSGPKMLAILAEGQSDPLYLPRRPLLYRDHDGRSRLARPGEIASESHPDQILASFASLGLPSTFVLHSEDASASIADLIEDAMSNFHLHGELEWTIIALASYAPTSKTWTNRWGRIYSFDAIAEHLLSQPIEEGACNGTHKLFALAVLLRVNSEQRLISPKTHILITNYLADCISRLSAHQRISGQWTPDWPHPLASPDQEKYDQAIFGEARMVQVTGHHLEWLAIAPRDLNISLETSSRALKWCLGALERVKSVDETVLCPYSHCFRILQRFQNTTTSRSLED